jgi:hypothetical protein
MPGPAQTDAGRQPIAPGAEPEMTYCEDELEEIADDRDRLRAWWWRIAHHQRRPAARYRRESRAGCADGLDRLP